MKLFNSFKKAILIAVSSVFILGGIAYAAWEYKFPTVLTDNSSATRAYVPVVLGWNGQTFVDAGKIAASGLDSNMQIGVSSIKYMVSSTNVTAVIPSLPASGKQTLDFYTGYTPNQTVFPIIAGLGGFITTSDNATLEPSGHFTDEWDNVYLDTTAGANKYLVKKPNALSVYVSPTVSGNITAHIGLDLDSENLTPNAAGDYTNITSATPAVAHYLNVDDPPGAPDFGTTSVETNNAVQQKDVYNITAPPIVISNPITSVTVVYCDAKNAAGAGFVQPLLRLGVNETLGTEVASTNGVWNTRSETLGRPGGSTWTFADLAGLQVGVGVRGDGAATTEYVTQVFVLVSYTPVTVSATGVTSAAHTVKLEYTPNLLTNSSFETADPPADWNLAGAGATVSRSNAQFHEGLYSALLTRNGADCALYQDYPGFASLRGKTITVGGWVYATVANRARIYVRDNVGSSTTAFHSGVAGWEWLSATFTVDAAATLVQTASQILTGDTSAYFDGLILIIGSSVPDYNTLRLYINGIDSARTYTEVSVPDNANAWTWGYGTATPYIGSFKHYVGGTLVAWYEPNTMLIGTTVVDRQGADHPGTITWGTNSSMTITYGEMTSYESTTAAATQATGFGTPNSYLPATWFASGANLANLPFYDSFLEVSNQTGQPLQTIYFIAIIGFAFGVFLLLAMFTRSALLGVIGFVLVLFLGSSMTIVPMWIPFSTLIVMIGIMYLYRQVAY